MVGTSVTPDDRERILGWMLSGEVGLSSRAIATVGLAGGGPGTPYICYPLDPADLRRCLRLLDLAPSLRDVAFPRLAAASPVWAELIAVWDDLVVTFIREVGPDYLTETGWQAPHTHAWMQAAIKRGRRHD